MFFDRIYMLLYIGNHRHVSEGNNNEVVNICLGSAFLCLATTHMDSLDDKKKNK